MPSMRTVIKQAISAAQLALAGKVFLVGRGSPRVDRKPAEDGRAEWPEVGSLRPWDTERDCSMGRQELSLAGSNGSAWSLPPDRPWPGVRREIGVHRTWQGGWRPFIEGRQGRDAVVSEVWTGAAWRVEALDLVGPASIEKHFDAWGRPHYRASRSVTTGKIGSSCEIGPARPLTAWALKSDLEAVRWFLRQVPADFNVAGLVQALMDALATNPGATWPRFGGRQIQKGQPLLAARLLLEPSLRSAIFQWAQKQSPTAFRPLLAHPDREVRTLGLQLSGTLYDEGKS